MKTLFTRFLYPYLVGSLLIAGIVSCEEDDDPDEVENKITAVNLQFDSNQKGKADATARFSDLNGVDGKTSPNTITLEANNAYAGTITLEDETQTPKTNVTANYTITYEITGVDATISAAGPTPTVQTQGTGIGTLRVTMTESSKSISVTFPLRVL